jgi:hypothetical protein
MVDVMEVPYDRFRDGGVSPPWGHRPTRRCHRRGPRRRATGAFGQHRCDQVSGEATSQGPGRQHQLGERVGLFKRAEQALHAGIIIAYAVAEA